MQPSRENVLRGLERIHKALLKLIGSGKLREADKATVLRIAQEVLVLSQEVGRVEALDPAHSARLWRLVTSAVTFLWRRGGGG